MSAVDPALRRRVLDAHGDAWQAEGRRRAAHGGGAAEIRGARLMASGIATAKWNNADITDAGVDLDAMRAWYAVRDVPWGMRVPLGLEVDLGTPLFEKRSLYLAVSSPWNPPPSSLSLRRCGGDDFETFAAAEVAAFGGDLETSHRWLAPVFGSDGFEHWIAADPGGAIAAIASTVRTDERAGPAMMVTGVASVGASHPRDIEGFAAAIIAASFDEGVGLVHAHAIGEAEAALWLGLGFAEVPGFLIRVVRPD